jgi:hypothetical protein
MLAGGGGHGFAVAGAGHAFAGGGQEFGGFTDRGSIPVSKEGHLHDTICKEGACENAIFLNIIRRQWYTSH